MTQAASDGTLKWPGEMNTHVATSNAAVGQDAQHVAQVRRVTGIGLAINRILSALKFVGGVIGSSQAVVADAVHSLSDSVTDVAILVGVRYWSKPPDAEHPHGQGVVGLAPFEDRCLEALHRAGDRRALVIGQRPGLNRRAQRLVEVGLAGDNSVAHLGHRGVGG